MAFIVSLNKYCYKNKRERGACRIKSPKLTVQRLGQPSKTKTRRRSALKEKMVAKLLELKMEMKEISEEQSSIKEGQRQVKETFEAIESECKNLRKETMIIMQQSAYTRLRLAFMFQILKARENEDFAKAAELTNALRKLIAKQNQNDHSLEPTAEAGDEQMAK
ncbi:uncharacterized protein LOC111294352 [Durio zibethinus]|uniref:Uncharacterized protein LOC111286843 n=1 Tax=Durio zibethinus TaxID=66656 RepID=A0A6P5YT75_DURZI|nr:uncharacterized protein LOC111286843 [Durio zibethinus]XP_022743366.1 uncharacterized protein LOC111294352 [Durio zibethinus]